MHVSTNPKSKEPLKLTATEKNRLEQASEVAKAVGGGALMLGDMELREKADAAFAAVETLKLYLSDKRPKVDEQTSFLNKEGESDGNSEGNRSVDTTDAAHTADGGDSEERGASGTHRDGGSNGSRRATARNRVASGNDVSS